MRKTLYCNIKYRTNANMYEKNKIKIINIVNMNSRDRDYSIGCFRAAELRPGILCTRPAPIPAPARSSQSSGTPAPH